MFLRTKDSGTGHTSTPLNLRADEWVEVRSKEEILASLDEHGRLEGTPFMPEMFQYCGRRFRVFKRAHKTCDTIYVTGRRSEGTVHLEDVRCDGAAHGGCQAACMIFWKEAWLRRVADGPTAQAEPASKQWPMRAAGLGGACTEHQVRAAALAPGQQGEKDPTYVCQATTLLEATKLLPWWDIRQYVEDYVSGNVDAERILRGLAYVFLTRVVYKAQGVGRRLGIDFVSPLIRLHDAFQSGVAGVPFPRKNGTIPKGQGTPSVASNFVPGELVRVRSHDEILATLDTDNKNRGLYFDAEHVPYCNGTYSVKARINKIIDEKTGKMIHFKTDSIILDNVFCQSRYSYRRMFCPRAIYPYWREIWLERVEAPLTARVPEEPRGAPPPSPPLRSVGDSSQG